MSSMTVMGAGSRKVPWHLWVVGLVGLPWNGYGAYNYVMTQTRGDAYLLSQGMNEAQIAAVHAMPAWMSVFWALGVWGGMVGTLLLLGRFKWALHAFVVSLGGFLVSLVYTYGMSDAGAANGTQGMIMNAVILAGCLFFVWYSQQMVKRGVLR